MRAGRLAPGASFGCSSEMPGRKQSREKPSTGRAMFPHLKYGWSSASTSSELISETGSLADSDIRDVDLDSANVAARSQVIDVSVHQGPVEAMPAIDADQAGTMDNLVPAA